MLFTLNCSGLFWIRFSKRKAKGDAPHLRACRRVPLQRERDESQCGIPPHKPAVLMFHVFGAEIQRTPRGIFRRERPQFFRRCAWAGCTQRRRERKQQGCAPRPPLMIPRAYETCSTQHCGDPPVIPRRAAYPARNLRNKPMPPNLLPAASAIEALL
jgi:hypothetical protein